MNNQKYLLALNRMPQVGPKTIQACLKKWPHLKYLFDLNKSEMIEAGLPAPLAETILKFDWQQLEQDEEWLKQQSNRKVLTILDHEYPFLLKEIHDPPPILYVEGQLEALSQPTVAIVGTRKPTSTGINIAKDFAFQLARLGITVVSGLALGIDSAAHEGCIMAQGKTIAVMGTGLNCIYPKQHVNLSKKIIQNGLIVSEFPLNTPPLAGHFPRRNRIISGLSLSILVVESAVRSGSLLTARIALEQNREVMAVPGSIRNSQVAGCHLLLQQGAKLVTSIEDVLEGLSSESASKHLKGKYSPIKYTEDDLLQLLGDEWVTVDQLVVRSGRSIEDIICKLMELELDGVVQSRSGGYKRCIL